MNLFSTSFLTTGALFFALTATAAESKMAAGKYEVDAAHSSVAFEVPHLVISTVEGKFTKMEGTIDLNEKFEKSSVKATAEIASVDTGNEKRDGHLKSADFFDAAKNPKMSFESTELKGTPESFKLTGNLKIKTTTKKVTFEGKYLGSVKDGQGQEKVAFKATTKISRKDFGLTYGAMVEAGPVIGDEITITLKIQAAKVVATK
ncbi:MAG: YceI family protein [Pseudobdellovibrio sp.]